MKEQEKEPDDGVTWRQYFLIYGSDHGCLLRCLVYSFLAFLLLLAMDAILWRNYMQYNFEVCALIVCVLIGVPIGFLHSVVRTRIKRK